jgi:hypothetical protein
MVVKDEIFRMRKEKVIQALAGRICIKKQDKWSGLSDCWSWFDWMSLEQMGYLPVTIAGLDGTLSLQLIAYCCNSVPEARSAGHAFLSVSHLSYLCRRGGVFCVAIRIRVGQLTSRALFLGRCKSFYSIHSFHASYGVPFSLLRNVSVEF